MNKLNVLPLQGDVIKSKLRELKVIFETSYGPKGKLKLFYRDQSNEISCGSSSSFLLNYVLKTHEEDPIIKLIFTSIKQHVANYKDFGIFCSLLCFSLILQGLSLDVPISIVTKCYERFLADIPPFFQSVSQNIDVGSLKAFSNLLSGIVRSKQVLRLNQNEIENFSIQITKACVKQLPSHGWKTQNPLPTVVYQRNCAKNGNIHYFNGVLMDLSHHTSADIQELCENLTSKRNLRVLVVNLQQLEEAQNDLFKTANSVPKLTNAVLETFTRKIVDCNISVLFSQRIIGDHTKKYLLENNTTVIDRIGQTGIETIKEITKCKIIQYFCEDLQNYVGSIESLNSVTFDTKSYILVSNCTVPLCSLLVFYGNPTIENDVRHVCTAAMHTFWHTVNSQKVVVGGGHLEAMFAQHLLRIYQTKPPPDQIPCSNGQFFTCLQSFCTTFEYIGKLLSDGSMSPIDIQDCYEAKYNAVMVAVQTACMVLGIKFQITD